jgi:hypothetical protein
MLARFRIFWLDTLALLGAVAAVVPLLARRRPAGRDVELSESQPAPRDAPVARRASPP